MKKNSRNIIISLVVSIFILSLVTPVQAWSDVGVEYYDSITETIGTWDESDNEALESSTVGFHMLGIKFIINSVDQTADVYKIRIDYDGADSGSPETLQIYYRWGTTGSFLLAATFGGTSEDDFQVTINDPTSTTLQLSLVDTVQLFEFQRDRWYFGREPELWMYWN
ncbi:MAG: hypothetical protein E4H14_00455 [Candidatus Thorarchaeota archaeon]|nr:MAG: hypothetical protein E4H14_00455 [Candidatus Thorarchaeota archaeon]